MPNESVANPGYLQELTKYRQRLLDQSAEMQAQLDKNLLALSGGAIGISFVFLNNAKAALGISHISSASWLIAAWIGWSISVAAVLGSYFTSSAALMKAARLVDDGTIFMKWSKGFWNRFTQVLNSIAAILFFVGMSFLICFIIKNIP